MTVSLGMPAAPAKVLAPRRESHKIKVGSTHVRGDTPVSVQSVTNIKTTDINDTLQQIIELTAAGCNIVKVVVPSADDMEALPITAMKSQIPVTTDIHLQPRYVSAAIGTGCTAVRINPGNIKQFDDKVAEIVKATTDVGMPLRIGVNAGSLNKRLLTEYGAPAPEVLVESVMWEASLFEQVGFYDFKISAKHHDPVIMVRARELLAEAYEYPLHPGVTEAGPAFQGTVESSMVFGVLLNEGIGDAIRVSLFVPPAEEVKVGTKILESLSLRSRKLDTVSRSSYGHAQVDVYTPTEEMTKGLGGMKALLWVAVMERVVNGPGEAREADLGVASGDRKGKIFIHGGVIKTVPGDQTVETLLAEAHRIATEVNEVSGSQIPVS